MKEEKLSKINQEKIGKIKEEWIKEIKNIKEQNVNNQNNICHFDGEITKKYCDIQKKYKEIIKKILEE